MSFAAPSYLFALAAVPLALLLYLWSERRAGRARDAFALPAVRASVTPQAAGLRRHVPVLFAGGALAILVLALAKPQATVAVPVEQATVMLVTDRSGSMLSTDVPPNRLTAARQAGKTFLDEVPDDIRVGVVAFNHEARILQTPTRDHVLVGEVIDDIKAAGSTATGDALDLALRVAQTTKNQTKGAKKPPAAIILLSDGKSVRGRDPLKVAEQAKQAGVKIYTVALGTQDGTIQVPRRGGGTKAEPVPPDPEAMQEIAQISGGRTFSTGDATKLEDIYKDLGSQVATEKQKREITVAFAGGALLLLVGAVATSLGWFGRLV